MKSFADGLAKVLCYIIAVLLGAITVLNVLQVLARYAFPSFVIYWSEDVTVLVIFWIMCLGTPALWLQHGHLTMDILSTLVKNREFHWYIDLLINVVAFLCGIGMTYGGMVSIFVNRGIKGGALMLDESVRYLPLPVLGVGLAFAAIICVLELITEKRHGKEGEE